MLGVKFLEQALSTHGNFMVCAGHNMLKINCVSLLHRTRILYGLNNIMIIMIID